MNPAIVDVGLVFEVRILVDVGVVPMDETF
jgi:hypothetical protein